MAKQRLSRIVTKTGDKGTTGIADGSRVLKNTARIQAIGEIDELNCQLGVCMAHLKLVNLSELEATLFVIQHHLFNIGAELSLPDRVFIQAEQVSYLETLVDIYNADLAPLEEFILPGGNLAVAQLHLSRAICRRAERAIVTLDQEAPQNSLLLQYINRLSDYLFVLLRVVIKQLNTSEIYWSKPDEP